MELIEKYLDGEEHSLICRLVLYFKKTVQKQSNFFNSREMKKILYVLQDRVEKQIERYQVKEIDVEEVTALIKENLK